MTFCKWNLSAVIQMIEKDPECMIVPPKTSTWDWAELSYSKRFSKLWEKKKKLINNLSKEKHQMETFTQSGFYFLNRVAD